MKKLSYPIILILVLMFLVPQAGKAQAERITITDDSTMYWGEKFENYGPAQKKKWWNIDQSSGLFWEYQFMTSILHKYLKVSMLNNYPAISGTNDTIDFRNGNLYEDLYMDNLYLYPSSMSFMQNGTEGQDSVLHILSRLEPKATNVTENGKMAYTFDFESLASGFPAATVTDERGNKGISYAALLPVLLQGMENLNNRLERQQYVLDSLQSAKQDYQPQGMKTDAVGSVSYKIPVTAGTAYLQLCDETGRQVRMVDVSGTEKMSVSREELPNGIGYYSLIVDGNLIETKKITLK